MDLLADYSNWIVAVSAGLVLLAGLLRKVKRKGTEAINKANLAMETLLGRDEIRHPETGDILVEATPNLGMRFARMEDAIVKMADTTNAVSNLTARVDDLTTVVHAHITACETPKIVPPVTVINER